jgi:hypothetical protein
MPTYSIQYDTCNKYENRIKEAFLEFLIFPNQTDDQKILEENIETSISSYYFAENHHGFKVLRTRLSQRVKQYALNLQAKIEVNEYNPFNFKSLSLQEELEIRTSHTYRVEHAGWLSHSPFSEMDTALVENQILYNQKSALFEFMTTCNAFVHAFITFSPPHADVHKLLNDLINEPYGVCQDYSHLLLHVLRENAIPARYVSGYLNQGQNYMGDAALHAWVEAHLPGVGWIGLDPTNNLLVDHNYIKIAHGIDYSECASVKGTIKAPGTNTTEYTVQVQQQ